MMWELMLWNGQQKVEKLGAGEILLTSMDCDGTKAGYGSGTLQEQSAEEVSIPVIASGGAGNLEHFYDALTEGKQMQRWRHLYSITKNWNQRSKEYLRGKVYLSVCSLQSV